MRDGVVLRAAGDEALYLVVDAPGEHIRFRYLHMNPHLLDAAGMVSGRKLSEGEVIGAVDNYERRQGGTTYHLHFDVQVPTRAGWVFVNPYMTLVAAYERLIGGRGQVVSDAMFATAAKGAAAPAADGQTTTPQDQGDAQGVPNSADIAGSKPAAPRPLPFPASGEVGWGRPSIRGKPPMNADQPAPSTARRAWLKAIAGGVAGLMLPKAARAERAEKMPFDRWIAAFRTKAMARGITAATYARVMRTVRPDMAALEASRNQPEFNEQLWQYLNRRVSDWRIIAGREKAKQYAPLFSRIERDFGVERSIMLGVWGIESTFGDPVVQKNHMRPVIPSLATLAWGEPHRRAYWQGELINALTIIQRGWSSPRANGRLLGGRHGPHPMDAGGLAACRHRL